ncbi:PrgI family protein [Patescibacteria group bacterium]|nr:PrgI family protein [Patescibacteria group bacterium]MBU1727966.1 PrgI family protein [Patescibacteria group bacterium]
MQFKVPQFLDIEDKIFGPFTFRQFVYLAGGGGLCFVLYKALGLLFGFIPMLLVAGLSLLLTFYRPNGKPFINMIEAGFKFFFQDKLYIWKRRKAQAPTKAGIQKTSGTELKKINEGETRLGKSKLRDLAWSLDVLDLKKDKEGESR